MKYGVFTVSMPEYTIEETLNVLKELGYDGVEWRVQEVSDQTVEDVPFESRYWVNNKSTININTIVEEADSIRELCRKKGIEILGLTTYLNPKDHEAIEAVLIAAKKMEAPHIRVFTPGYDGSKNHEIIFEETRAHCEVLEKLAMKYEVKILFEIHMDNILASPSAAFRLLQGFDSKALGVIFDPGNMVYEGYEDYRKSFEILGDYIKHVHIKNGCMVEDGMDEFGGLKWKRQWVPLKKGMANLKHFFEVLKQMGYEGNISIEDFSNEQSTYDKLKDNLIYVKVLHESIP